MLQRDKGQSFNLFKPNGISHSSIGPVCFHFKGLFFVLLSFSGDPDQMLHSMAFVPCLHCLPMSHKKGARLL